MPDLVLHLGAAVTAGALLLAAAQPIMTDDVWWHLAMGEHYARQGPLLTADPLLHTATGPAAPAAWLFDVALSAGSRWTGMQGLRCVHAGLALAIAALAWSLLRRASGSARLASLGTIAFIQLALYRLVQLRPHLATIVLTLVLLHLVVVKRGPPSWWCGALVVLVCALWSNMHAAFVLGPLLLAAGAAGVGVAHLFSAGDPPDASRRRALGLGLLFVVSTAATLLNPIGPDQLLHYFAAGDTSPALEMVRDEWAPLRLLAWPLANLPPSLLAWAIAWGLVGATPLVIALEVRARLATRDDEGAQDDSRPGLDPALAAMALASLALMVMAVRFLWLGIVPLTALCQWLAWRSPAPPRARLRATWAAAVAVLVLVPVSLRVGDWPMISRGVQPGLYGRAYPAIKYHAHAVWMLADAGLEGRLFNSYFMGNFLGYWLAPEMQAFANGSLNLPPAAMTDHHALMARRGEDQAAGAHDDEGAEIQAGGEGATFTGLLDRHGVDVFLGEGLPVQARRNRPGEYTTSHLEATPGWIQIFRNVHASLFLRLDPDDPRSAENLRRVTRYYEREGVPFDPERGFVVADVLLEAPRFAEAHAVVPSRLDTVQRRAHSPDPVTRHAAQRDFASILLLVGEYDRAAALLAQAVASDPDDLGARRRLVWTLLHAGRLEESRAAGLALREAAAPDDAFSAGLADAALAAASLSPDERRALVASLPAFTRAELRRVFHGYVEPEPRPIRRDRFAERDEPAGSG